MTEAQRQHWELLLEVDERGRRLTQREKDFVAGLIDAKPSKEGLLDIGEMNTIRGLHRRRVEGIEDDEDEL